MSLADRRRMARTAAEHAARRRVRMFPGTAGQLPPRPLHCAECVEDREDLAPGLSEKGRLVWLCGPCRNDEHHLRQYLDVEGGREAGAGPSSINEQRRDGNRRIGVSKVAR